MGRRIPPAIAAGCYTLGGIAGLALARESFGWGMGVAALWVAYGVGLLVLLVPLGGPETGCSAAVGVMVVSALTSWVLNTAWDDVVLKARGHQVRVVVAAERVEGSGKTVQRSYVLRHRVGGTRVPGPEMRPESGDRLTVGSTLTVYEDPRGELEPRTPGQVSPRGDLVSAALGLAGAVGAVAWTARRGFRRRSDEAREAGSAAREAEQEERLRTALRGRGERVDGYVRVSAAGFPDLTAARAARIAWEEGLRAEADGADDGWWRFAERVDEEAPMD